MMAALRAKLTAIAEYAPGSEPSRLAQQGIDLLPRAVEQKEVEAFHAHKDLHRVTLEKLIEDSAATDQQKKDLKWRLGKLAAFTDSASEFALAHFADADAVARYRVWKESVGKS